MKPRATGDDSWTRLAGRGLTAVTLVVAGFATLTPSSQTITWGPWCLACGDLSTVDIVLNVLMFVPLGIGLVLAGVRPMLALLAACLVSLSIELAQVTVVAGRDASVGDLLTNTVGGGLGAAFGARLGAVLWPSAAGAQRLAIGWFGMLAGVQALATFAFVPAPTELVYSGHIGRSLGGRPAYPGRIASVRVGSHSVPNTWFDGEGVRAELSRHGGGALAVDLIPPAQPPAWSASIARIVDVRRREIIELSQAGLDATYGVRTNAAAIRLRPVRIRLQGAFASPSPGETLTITAGYGASLATLRAQAGGESREMRARLSPGQAWRLLSPFSADMTGRRIDVIMAAVWLLALLAPLGYWIGAASRWGAPVGGTAWLPAVGALAVTLVALPLAFGTHVATLPEWIGAVMGIAIGRFAAAIAPRLG